MSDCRSIGRSRLDPSTVGLYLANTVLAHPYAPMQITTACNMETFQIHESRLVFWILYASCFRIYLSSSAIPRVDFVTKSFGSLSKVYLRWSIYVRWQYHHVQVWVSNSNWSQIRRFAFGNASTSSKVSFPAICCAYSLIFQGCVNYSALTGLIPVHIHPYVIDCLLTFDWVRYRFREDCMNARAYTVRGANLEW